MILDFIFNLLFEILNFAILPITILPDVSLPVAFTDAITNLKPYYNSLNTVLPVAAIVSIIAFEIVVDFALFTYQLIRWGYQKLPFLN